MQQIRSVVRNIGTGMVVACATAIVAVQSALAGVPAALSQASEGAQLVVIIPSMSEFSGKLAMINQTLGLEIDELTDALGSFKAEAGITGGLDDTGSALFVIHDLATAIDTKDEPDIVMILPVTDYQTFIASFQPEGAAPAGDGVTAVTLPDGQDGFAKEAGGYAIMGNTEEAIANYTAGGDADAIAGRIGALGQHYIDTCDAAAYVDMAAIAPSLNKLIDDAVAEMEKEFAKMGQAGMAPGTDMESMKFMFSLYATAGQAVVNSADGMVFSLDLSEHGIGFTKSGQFKPDSPVMQYLPGGGPGTADTLARLPKGSYIAAMAYDAESLAFSKLMEAALTHLPEGNAQFDMYRKALPLVKQIKQYAGVFYTPAPNALMTQTGVLNMLQTYKVDDSAAYLTKTREYITAMNGVSLPLGVPAANGQGAAPAMTYTTSYSENALQLDGVQVDQYAMNVQMPPELVMQMGPAAGMMTMFTNFNGYATQADGHYLASTTLDQQLITQGLATAKTGDGIGSDDPLALVREKAVPPGAAAEGYLSFAGIVETVGPMAAMFGMPAVQAPADLPPVAAGLGIQGNSSAARLYVPNETTKFIIDTIKDVQAQMMGGGPGGPGGGPQGGGAPPPPF